MTSLTQQEWGGNEVAEKRVDFTYNLASQFDTITRYNDAGRRFLGPVATTQYTYDGAGRLQCAFARFGVDRKPRRSGDRLWLRLRQGEPPDQLHEFGAHPDEDATYQYDAKDQLTAVNHDDPNTDDETYDYDENGNREEANGDSYWQWSNNQIFFDGTFYYTYDDEGNLTMRQAEDESELDIYQYDHRNRLTKASLYKSSGTQIVAYTYDAFDRLVKREVDTTSPYTFTDAQTEYFVYDGADVALKFDGDGSLTTRYLNGPAVDQILAEETLGHEGGGLHDGRPAHVHGPSRLGPRRNGQHRRAG